MNYLKVFADFEEAAAALTDEEKGALLLAMLRYASTGEDQMDKLSGAPRVLFPCFRMDIDHEEEMYQTKVNNGRKGGSPAGKKGKDAPDSKPEQTGRNRNEPEGTEAKRSQPESPYQEQDQDQEQEQDHDQDHSCTGAPRQTGVPPVITIPLNNGSEFPVSQEEANEYASLYPAVDIMQELRNIRGWCISNGKKRKTRDGIRRFINGWMARAQDRGGTGCKAPPTAGNPYRENPFLAMAGEQRTHETVYEGEMQ